MSRLYTAQQIAETALHDVGSFAPRDAAADKTDLERALQALDLIQAELAGVLDCWWLVKSDFTVALVAGTETYILADMVGDDGNREIEFVLDVHLSGPGIGTRRQIPVWTSVDIAKVEDLATTGAPEGVYVNRASPATLRVWPVPAVSGYSLTLTAQHYPIDAAAPGAGLPHASANAAGARNVEMPRAWQRWAILATAYDISNGRVRKMPLSERAAIRKDRDDARAKLEAFQNTERKRPVFVRPRDF